LLILEGSEQTSKMRQSKKKENHNIILPALLGIESNVIQLTYYDDSEFLALCCVDITW